MTAQQQHAPASTPERDMLTTWVQERCMDVVTSLHTTCVARSANECRPWTAVWAYPRPDVPYCVWLRFYDGPTSPGGLEEAHQAVVQQVQAGTLPKEDER